MISRKIGMINRKIGMISKRIGKIRGSNTLLWGSQIHSTRTGAMIIWSVLGGLTQATWIL